MDHPGTPTPIAIQRCAALAISALLLFIPANLLPILHLSQLGHETRSTIWEGVVALWESGTREVALLVFACSIVIPLLKIVAMLWLCATWRSPTAGLSPLLVRIVDAVGRWSMLDVFLVAILVSLVKLGDLARVTPGPGLLAFTAVVVLTMLATATFDRRLAEPEGGAS